MLGDEELAKEFSARLFEEGVFASAICYPMVSPEDSVACSEAVVVAVPEGLRRACIFCVRCNRYQRVRHGFA